jgi:hypothetical protein
MARTRVRASAALLLLLSACSGEEIATPPSPPPPSIPPAPAKAVAPPIPDPAPEPWEIEKDPIAARTLKLEEAWRLDPAFTDMKLRFFDVRPALVAIEVRDDGRAENAVGERLGIAVRHLADGVRAFLKEAGLDAPPLEEMGDERIRVMVFRGKEAYDSWHTRNRIPGPMNAYYSRTDRVIRAFAGAVDPSVVQYLGTFALRHVYARHFCDAEDAANSRRTGGSPARVNWDDKRLNTAFAWFDRGLARYFGDFRAKEGGWKGRYASDDMAFVIFMSASRKTWPLEELMFRDTTQIHATAQVKGGGAGMGEELVSLASAQGHLLVRYFLEGEEGKWRSGFQKLVRNEFTGRSATPYLLEAFGLVNEMGNALHPMDPKVRAWIREVEAGYLKFAKGLK